MKTISAQTAQAVRKELKALFPSIKFTCKSSNYAGGNSVRVSMQDQPREIMDVIESALGKYQYGRFDGMTDSYEYSNKHDDIPQVKYLFIENNMSDEKKQDIYENIILTWALGEELPETFEDAISQNIQFHGQFIDEMVYREFKKAA